ncbi:hypothetical protein FHL15_008867 [Xylaria flabelliformis]|uniref:Uncharacterized protein n=1 Tax=Xylaria flabelliformis TaxID=2512241 RepID=A0A553HQT4_9PEZI|nr:hypothetical protein FHL15_008867 [Xylaria flabelliformis]
MIVLASIFVTVKRDLTQSRILGKLQYSIRDSASRHSDTVRSIFPSAHVHIVLSKVPVAPIVVVIISFAAFLQWNVLRLQRCKCELHYSGRIVAPQLYYLPEDLTQASGANLPSALTS